MNLSRTSATKTPQPLPRERIADIQACARPAGSHNVGLRNGLLQPKHYLAMRGDALWLYSFLLDRQTRRLDKHGLGKVAGGAPVSDGNVAESLGCSEKTVSRWRRKLLRGSYITAKRTPYGYVYAIAKPKKWDKADRTETADHSHGRSDTNSVSIDRTETADHSPHKSERNRTEVSARSDRSVRNKEEMSRGVRDTETPQSVSVSLPETSKAIAAEERGSPLAPLENAGLGDSRSSFWEMGDD
jgi:hypothetical protein